MHRQLQGRAHAVGGVRTAPDDHRQHLPRARVAHRLHGRVPTQETLLGWVPRQGDINTKGLDISPDNMGEATSIKTDEWKSELKSQEVFFEQLGTKAPEALMLQRKLLISRLGH